MEQLPALLAPQMWPLAGREREPKRTLMPNQQPLKRGSMPGERSWALGPRPQRGPKLAQPADFEADAALCTDCRYAGFQKPAHSKSGREGLTVFRLIQAAPFPGHNSAYNVNASNEEFKLVLRSKIC
jgi:hypothetical protein